MIRYGNHMIYEKRGEQSSWTKLWGRFSFIQTKQSQIWIIETIWKLCACKLGSENNALFHKTKIQPDTVGYKSCFLTNWSIKNYTQQQEIKHFSDNTNGGLTCLKSTTTHKFDFSRQKYPEPLLRTFWSIGYSKALLLKLLCKFLPKTKRWMN